MIRTKWLEVEYGFTNYQEIDDLINGFIKENPQIEIIDIKYQSNVSAVADSLKFVCVKLQKKVTLKQPWGIVSI